MRGAWVQRENHLAAWALLSEEITANAKCSPGRSIANVECHPDWTPAQLPSVPNDLSKAGISLAGAFPRAGASAVNHRGEFKEFAMNVNDVVFL